MKFLTVLRCLGTVLMKDINYFTVGDKSKSSQQSRRQSVSSVTLHWPLEGYEFCLACKLCFIKQGEGVGGMYSITSLKHELFHLGTMTTLIGACLLETTIRITMAKVTFLRDIQLLKDVNGSEKKSIKCYIESVLLCGNRLRNI